MGVKLEEFFTGDGRLLANSQEGNTFGIRMDNDR
jgi:hypothetical protein